MNLLQELSSSCILILRDMSKAHFKTSQKLMCEEKDAYAEKILQLKSNSIKEC